MSVYLTDNYLAVLGHIERAMNTESTVTELAQFLTRDQAALLTDAADWLREIVAARPPITPAQQWASPTELRKQVAQRTGAAREFVGRKPHSHFNKRRSR